MIPTTFFVLFIVFCATLVRSTFGFGESLMAVPLLAFFLPLEVAVPFSVLLSILIAAIILVQDRKKVHFKPAKWLIFFAILGIPFGLFLLVFGNESVVKIILGIFLVLYSGYSLLSKRKVHFKKNQKGWLFVCGFFSGVFGGAYGLNGPALVIYGDGRKWSPTHFRATLQAYFLPVSLVGMIGYWQQGLWTSSVTDYFLLSLPVAIPGIFLGRYLNHRLKTGTFLKYIYAGLICIGVLLLAQSVFF